MTLLIERISPRRCGTQGPRFWGWQSQGPGLGVGSVCLVCWRLLFAVAALGSAAEGHQATNTLLIFVDDQGYFDLGCYGAAVRAGAPAVMQFR